MKMPGNRMNNRSESRRPLLQSGFTLLELMIAVIIVGVLAMIAFPSYTESVLKTKRAEGKAALLNGMQQQERHYTLHSTYLAFNAESPSEKTARFKWFSGDAPSSSSYEIHAQACDGKSIRDCVQLVARPGTERVNTRHRDPRCGNLILTSEGHRSAAMTSCW